MQKTIATALVVLMCLAGGLATASEPNAPAGQSHVLPILVKVNTTGKVTDISPAYKLRPSFQRLLRNTIDKMITKPAMKKGKAVNSQLVITLAVLTNKAVNGKEDTTLKYLAARPLPPGSWHWIRNAENRLALSSQSSTYVIDYPPTDMDTLVESGADVN